LPNIDATSGIKLVNQTPGREQDIDAYQAEVGGIYGCIAFTNKLLSEYNTTQGQVTMPCDCLSALRNICTHDFDKPSQPHYDLIHACRLLVRESPIPWKERHVYGHQHDKKTYHLLDRWEQLNVDMDTLAKTKWLTIQQQRRPYFILPRDND
jgi:hypothetical protein